MNATVQIDMPFGEDRPVHGSGSYRAWEIGGEWGGLADLAWYSRVDYARPEVHRLLPFVEPSISLIRKFDRFGATTAFEITICPARPEGGEYMPQPGEEQFALRLVPERLERVFGRDDAEKLTREGRLPCRFQLRLDEALRLAERENFERAWHAMHLACRSEAEDASNVEDSITRAATITRRSAGRFDPSQLAALAEISPRHLHRCFRERFGFSPRDVSRRLRLTAALIEAELQAKPHWAAIAAGHGFSDQAHMIRECRAIMGESPGELHKLRHPMAVSFNT